MIVPCSFGERDQNVGVLPNPVFHAVIDFGLGGCEILKSDVVRGCEGMSGLAFLDNPLMLQPDVSKDKEFRKLFCLSMNDEALDAY